MPGKTLDFSFHRDVESALAAGRDPRSVLGGRSHRYGPYCPIPCGKCVACRLARSREWALRCMHEASLSDNNIFVTLTYRPDRLRKSVGPCRYYACGEYGTDFSRPHYHAIIFGLDFDDKVLYKTTPGGRLYTSATLERVWGHGFCPFGDVTMQSAAYVARYCTKKITGDDAPFHYLGRPHEDSRSSNRPGIGAGWMDRYWSDVYPSGYCTVDGHKAAVPRYYDKLLERRDPGLYDRVRLARQQCVEKLPLRELSPSRLYAKGVCSKAAFNKLIRSIEVGL